MPVPEARIRHLNDAAPRTSGDYVLYWMQAYRRLERNHALEHAADLAREFHKPLVVYEGLKLGYPWASRRLHRFILEGIVDNATTAAKRGINYWPFVETPADSGRGLLRRLASAAVAVVTDDFPCFIIPEQSAALAARTDAPVVAVDGNSVVPLALLGEPASAAVHLRRRIHKAFDDAWPQRATHRISLSAALRRTIEPPFELWQPRKLDSFLDTLPIDATVREVPGVVGGARAARAVLRTFLRHRLAGYAERRSHPTSPDEGHASGLSPYLHFGHISIEEVVEAVLGHVGADDGRRRDRKLFGKRDAFYSDDADANAFLDEAITWRDVGYHWHRARHADTGSLADALPAWALATLRKHAGDCREFSYTLEEWEAAETHDPLWNAAQKELMATGTIQNYLRMLWGKKVLEWSRTPEEAYATLVHLNNKYALDGRDPNSYTGILWCFGLFDRPWPPERPVFGSVRFMSSASTARKFKLQPYFAYVDGLDGQT